MKQHGALIAQRGAPLLDPLAEVAERAGFSVQRRGEAMEITAPLGLARFAPEGQGTRMELQSNTAAELQLFTDLYAQRLANIAPGARVLWDSGTGGQPLNQVIARLDAITQISPNFMRLTLAGDFSAFTLEAGLHFRLLIKPDATAWPSRGADGLTHWPGGMSSWHRPPYTVRRINDARSAIDVDIVLHNGGRVTDWCRSLIVGAEVALHGPSGSKQPQAERLDLIGDETALPVILRILEDAPAATKGRAVIAIRTPEDAQTITPPSGMTLNWVDMNDDAALLAAARSVVPQNSEHHVFFAAERHISSQAREIFQSNGLQAARAVSYWTRTA